MSPGRGFAQPRFRPLVAAAVLSILVAVASDLVGGEGSMHVATLGVVTAMVAALRLRPARQHRGLLQFVSGCVAVLPAVHAAAKLVPNGPLAPARERLTSRYRPGVILRRRPPRRFVLAA